MKTDWNARLDQKDWNERLDALNDDRAIIDGIVEPIVKELRKPQDMVELSNTEELAQQLAQPIVEALQVNNQDLQLIKQEQRTLFDTLKSRLERLLRRDNTKDITNSIKSQTKVLEALEDAVVQQGRLGREDTKKLIASLPREEKPEELSDMVELLNSIAKELKRDKKPSTVLTTPKIQDQFQRSNGERVAALVDTDNHLQVDIQTMPSSDPAEVREISLYAVNDMSDMVSNITYVGREKDNGSWCVVKMDETSGTSMLYATVANNAGITTYADAWTGRAGLTYNYYSVAF